MPLALIGHGDDPGVADPELAAHEGLDRTQGDIDPVHGDHVVDAARDAQSPVVPHPVIGGAEASLGSRARERLGGGLGESPVSRGDLGAHDVDASVLGQLHAHAGQRDAVVDAPAGRLGHAVRRDQRDTRVSRALGEGVRCGRRTDEHRRRVREPLGGRGRLEDVGELCRHE